MSNETKLADFPEPYHELYAAHHILRSLGFAPEEIFVAMAKNVVGYPGKQNFLTCVLKAQGDSFTTVIAHMGNDAVHEEIYARWGRYLEFIQTTTTEEEAQRCVVNTAVFKNKIHMVVALKNRGFRFKLPQPAEAGLEEGRDDKWPP